MDGETYEVEVKDSDYIRPENVPAPVAPAPQTAPAPVAEVKAAPSVKGEGTPVTAPMPGTVLKIKAANGTAVKKGDAVIILEAMKMENEIAATKDGIVSVTVKEGDKINTGDVIAYIG